MFGRVSAVGNRKCSVSFILNLTLKKFIYKQKLCNFKCVFWLVFFH